jgi:hypothetical protein
MLGGVVKPNSTWAAIKAYMSRQPRHGWTGSWSGKAANGINLSGPRVVSLASFLTQAVSYLLLGYVVLANAEMSGIPPHQIRKMAVLFNNIYFSRIFDVSCRLAADGCHPKNCM